jgi:hypothetical protein
LLTAGFRFLTAVATGFGLAAGRFDDAGDLRSGFFFLTDFFLTDFFFTEVLPRAGFFFWAADFLRAAVPFAFDRVAAPLLDRVFFAMGAFQAGTRPVNSTGANARGIE